MANITLDDVGHRLFAAILFIPASEGPLEQFYRFLLRWLQSTISGRHCKVSVQRIDDVGVVTNSTFSVAQIAKEAVAVCTAHNALQCISCFRYTHLAVVDNGSLQCNIFCVTNNKGRFFAASRIVFVAQVSVGVEELGRDLEVDFFAAVLLQILSHLIGFFQVLAASDRHKSVFGFCQDHPLLKDMR